MPTREAGAFRLGDTLVIVVRMAVRPFRSAPESHVRLFAGFGASPNWRASVGIRSVTETFSDNPEAFFSCRQMQIDRQGLNIFGGSNGTGQVPSLTAEVGLTPQQDPGTDTGWETPLLH